MDPSRHTKFITVAYGWMVCAMFYVPCNLELCYCFISLRVYSSKSSTCNQLVGRSVDRSTKVLAQKLNVISSSYHSHPACAPNNKNKIEPIPTQSVTVILYICLF